MALPRRDCQPPVDAFAVTTAVSAFVLVLSVMGLIGRPHAKADEPPLRDERQAKMGWQDLFDRQSLKGLTIVDAADFRHHGEVRVQNGELVLETGAPATGVRFQTDPLPEFYELSLQAKRVKGSDFFCGLTFPVGESQCTWIVGGWGGEVVGLSNVNGRHAAENETGARFEFKNGQWYALTLRVTQLTIDAWIDDRHIIRLPRKDRKFDIWIEQQPLAPLGIAAWQTEAAFQSIRVRALDATEETSD